jgi:hypothetical protein
LYSLLELSQILWADVEVTAVTSKLVTKAFDTLGRADTALLMVDDQMKLTSQIAFHRFKDAMGCFLSLGKYQKVVRLIGL